MGDDVAELELALERIDAIQSRLELLERDRDTRLREAAAHLRERRAREHELEDERNAAVKTAIEAQLRREALEAELSRTRAELSRTQARAEQFYTQIESLLEERRLVAEMADRAAASRAWRVGHRLTSVGRLLTFRRSHGTSALGLLQTRLKDGPRELPSGSATTLDDDGSGAN